MTRPEIGLISPCFIVSDAPRALAFYHDRLGFEITHQEPSEAPFFGIVQRGGAMLMLKDVGIPAMPNLKRHEWQRWDAYLYVPDPDALAAEFESRQVQFSEPLKTSTDGLRGFELRDPDGYLLFFGRPLQLPLRDTSCGVLMLSMTTISKVFRTDLIETHALRNFSLD